MDGDKKVKKADNEIGTEKEENSSLKKINQELENEKKHLKEIEYLQEGCIDVSKRFNRYLDLLSLSVRGPKVNREIDELLSNNSANISKLNDSFDKEKERIKNNINDLNYKKDNIQKEKRDNK